MATTPQWKTVYTEEPEVGQVATWDGTRYVNADAAAGSGGTTIDTDAILTLDGEVLVDGDGNVLTGASS